MAGALAAALDSMVANLTISKEKFAQQEPEVKALLEETEEERQRTEGGARRYFTGLPVTSAALIFPTVMLLQFITPMDITPLYLGVAVLTGFAFLAKFQMRKPGMRGVLIMVAIGAVEFIAMLILRSGLRLH